MHECFDNIIPFPEQPTPSQPGDTDKDGDVIFGVFGTEDSYKMDSHPSIPYKEKLETDEVDEIFELTIQGMIPTSRKYEEASYEIRLAFHKNAQDHGILEAIRAAHLSVTQLLADESY